MPEATKFIQVLPGTTESNETLNDGDFMGVYGSAVDTIVSGGSLVIYEGGQATGAAISSGTDWTALGSCVVSAGGSAENVTVGAGGELHIYDRVTSAVVSQFGTAKVYEGGQARNFTIDGGEMQLFDGAYVFPATGGSKLLVQNQGMLLLFEGARIEGVEAKDNGYVSLDKADMSSAFFSYGSATVRDGATLSSSTVNDGSVITVTSGGVVDNVTFNVGGKITGNMYDCRDLRFYAGIVDFNIVADYTDGGFYINELTTFLSPKTETYYCFYTVTAYLDQDYGTYKLIQDATGFLDNQEVFIRNYYGDAVLGIITIEEGTKMIEDRLYTLNMSDSHELTLTISAITPPDVKDNLETTCDLYDGEYGSNVNILADGYLNLNSGARALDTTVYDQGYLNVNDGGRASDTYIEDGGTANVSAGGMVNGVFVNAGGRLSVRTGGKAMLVRENGGAVNVVGDVEFEPNEFKNLTINGNATVHSGTTATSTTINDGGNLTVFSGGRAATTTVNANGSLVVSQGGVADGTLLVMPNGVVTVSSGGTLTGWLMLFDGSIVVAETDATIDFDLSQTKPGAAQGLVNKLSLVSGNPDFTITITGTEEGGQYTMAGDAAGFDKDIFVKTASGRDLGALSVGGAGLSYRDRTYWLSLESDKLTLTVNALPADITGDLNYEHHLATGEIASAVNVVAGGDLYVDEGGIAVDTTVNNGGWLDVTDGGIAYGTTVDGGGVYVYEDGVIYDTTINSGGNLTVSTGARAVGLTVEQGAFVNIYDGAAAYEIRENGGNVFVNSGAYVTFVPNEITGLDLVYDNATVHSGTTATYTTVRDYGRLEVHSGGLVSSSVVSADGQLALSGGKANGVVVMNGGYVYVASGGSVTGLDAEEGANLNFIIAPDTYAHGTFDGGDIDIAPETIGFTVSRGVSIEVLEGGLAGEITVESGGNCLVMSDGEVKEAVVHSGAYFYIANGGSATGLNVDDGARFYLSVAPYTYAQGTYGGEDFKATSSLSDYTVHSNGGLFVDEGGKVQNITVEYGADLYVSSGATATKITENGGYVSFDDGAKVTFTPNEFAGIATEDMVYRTITVHSGTTATDTTLNGEGQMEVYQGGYATVTTVNAYGQLSVSGGSADNTTVYADGSMTVCSGGLADETAIDGGDMLIGDGGFAYGINLANGGRLYVFEDGRAEDISVDEGYAYVFEGGKACNARLSAGAFLAVSSGGSADLVTVEQGAEVEIFACGTATNIWENGGYVFVEPGASAKFVSNTFTGVTLDCTSATVHSGTTATDTVVDGFGCLVVLGGRAIDTDVKSYGSLSIDYGGTANGITTQNDAYIEVKNGGKLTGAMTIGTGAYITAEPGATFDFDISPCSPDNAALVDDISVVISQPFEFTLTVNGMQEQGTYALAGNAASFNDVLYVSNATGLYLGALTVTSGAQTLDDGREYNLFLDGSDLCVTIGALMEDTDPPTVENIQADIATPTNQDVTVTADFLDNCAISERRYRLEGDTDWSPYPEGGVTVTENTTVYFVAVDIMGFESSEETITIDYIDKEAPTIVVSPDTTGLTESLTLKAEFNDNENLVGAYYKIGYGDWNPYSDEGVTVTENTTVAFQAYDEAGNETTVVYEVTNIGSADLTGDLNTTANLTDGMIGSDVHILDGGELNVSSGGRALETDVNDGGELSIYNGGIADVVTVNPGGTFYVNSGGAAYQVRENGGEVWGYLGMVVEIVPNEFTGVTIAKGDDATVHSGTTATDTTVQSGGFLEVYSGGTATGIDAEEGALLRLTVAPGTYEQGTYAGTGFEIGDTANGFRVHSGCYLYVSEGGVVRETVLDCDSYLYVSNGGVASDTTIEKSGALSIREGGSASGVTVQSGGYLFNNAGGSATGIVAADGAILFLDIAPDTYAQGTYNGSAFAFDSAVAGITVDSHCFIIPIIQDGGTADDVTIGSGCYLYVSYGGVADDITVGNGGALYVQGGKATQVRENGGYVMDYFDAVTYVSNTFTGLTITDSATVHSGTTAAHTTVEGENGDLQISGGAAIDTTVNDGGSVTIYYSGTADNTTVNSGGSFDMVGYNGIANNTTVNDGGKFYAPGGTVNGLVVGSGGSFEIHDKLTGKVVFDANAIVKVGGATVDFDLTQTAPGEDALINDLSFVMDSSTSYTLTVDASAEAGEYKLAEGAAGFDSFITVKPASGGESLGTLTVNSTKTFNGRDYTLTLTTEGLLGLTLGEMPVDLTGEINSDHYLTAGQYGSGVIINSDGQLFVDAGALAKETTIHSGGQLTVYAGGKAEVIDVNPGAYLDVAPGATALKIRENGGYASIEDGAIVTIVPNTFFDLVLANGGYATAHDGTTAKNTTVNEGGRLDIFCNGTAEAPTINSGGTISICAGGTVHGGEVNDGGLLELLFDGTIDGVTVNPGGTLNVPFGGGSALHIVENGGYVGVDEAASASFQANTFVAGVIEGPEKSVTVHSGTTATDADVRGGGVLLVYSGGSATNVTENGGCVSTDENAFVTFLPSDLTGIVLDKTARPYATVHSGTTATNATIADATVLEVCKGGIADDVALDGEGIFYVREGAVVSGAAINNGYFWGYGSAVDATVKGAGYARIEDGGVMNGVKVDGTARVDVSAGGRLTGKMLFDPSAIVSAYGGAVVDFDLTQTEMGMESLISDFSRIKGNPSYTLTVDGTQETGTYYLADSASTFNKTTITVRNASGTEYGTISVDGDPLSTVFADFTLKMTGDTLAVDVTKKEVVDELNPMIEVSADTEAPTNGNVTLTAVFDDDVAVAQSLYSVDGCETWLDYTGPVVVTENTTVSFKAVDTSGKETFYYYHVTNIDKEDPTIDVWPDTEAPAPSVTVTAQINDNVALAQKLYSIDGGEWLAYTEPVVVTENGTISFKAVDTAGNTKETSITVSNIDKSTPDTTDPTIDVSADITTLTNKDVTVTAIFGDNAGLAQRLYKFEGDESWQDYTGPVVVSENATVLFRAVDTSDNSKETSITVSYIDKVPPAKPVATANVTGPTNLDVTVTAAFSDDTVKKEYSTNGTDWGAYPGGITFNNNGTVYFRGLDAAGNISDVTEFSVTNIDKVSPAKPTASADITTPTTGKVTVTAVFSEDSAVKEYSLDGLVWEEYKEPLAFNVNRKVYFRGKDAAGNISELASYEISNIEAAPLLNGPDDTTNDWLYEKVTKKGGRGENAALVSQVVPALAYDSTIELDDHGTVQLAADATTYHNFVGKTESKEDGVKIDAADYAKIVLATGAQLQFSIDSQIGGKFIVYSYDTATNKMKALQTTKIAIKNGAPVSGLKSGVKLFEAGTYYISMQGSIPKKTNAPNGFYDVQLASETHFFLDDDDQKNNWLYEGGKKGRGLNDDVAGASVAAKNISRASIGKQIQVDAKAVEHDATGKYNNFVGFGDTTDYVKIHLDTAANLSLTLKGDKAAKLTICQLTKNKDDIVTGSKTLVTTTLKAGNGSAASSLKVLDAGDYYVAVTSTNAKKGDEAYYNVSVTSNSVFFDNCDDHANDWLYEKVTNKGGRGENTALVNSTGITIVDTLTNVQVDASVPTGEAGGWKNFVGYGDTVDYQKIVVKKDGATVSFKVDAKDQASFVIYSYDKAANKVKALQTSKLKKDGDIYTVTTAEYTFKEAGDYFIAVTSTNAKKGGNAYYNVELVSTNVTTADLLGDTLTADLAMPETASGLNLTDDLSFGQYGADALADASASNLAELDDKSDWQNLAKLA